MSLNSGHKIEYFTKEEDEHLKKRFGGHKDGIITLNPGRWFYTESFLKYANKYFNFKLRSDDVFVLTYPKCGTTWTIEVVWTMRNNPDLNKAIASADFNYRTPFLEFDFIQNTSNVIDSGVTSNEFMSNVRKKCPNREFDENEVFFNLADSLESPRTIKTHLPFTLMPKEMLDTCKVVYVIRHPKDVCLSFYHHHKILTVHDFKGSLDEFIDFFINDQIMYSPFWEHVKEAWRMRDHPNLFISFYEKMKQNPITEYKRLDEFLGTNLSAEQLGKIVQNTTFANMKSRSEASKNDSNKFNDVWNMKYINANGGFFRKGKSGGWKNLTREQNEKLDTWIEENLKEMDEEFISIFNSL